MLFAPIVPISLLEEIRSSPYHMVLAPLCRFKEYFQFYRSIKAFKILDNGVAEGVNTSIEDLLLLADEMQADEVIAPDVYGDMHKTRQKLVGFMPFAENYNVMAVLQCNTWNEFDVIFHEALDLGVSTLALPRVMCDSLGPSARVAAAELIRRFSDIPIHALGCTKHMREARDLARQGIVRGIDSSAPVVNGLANLGIRDTYVERPVDFFFAEPTTMARLNLDAFRNWCATTPIS